PVRRSRRQALHLARRQGPDLARGGGHGRRSARRARPGRGVRGNVAPRRVPALGRCARPRALPPARHHQRGVRRPALSPQGPGVRGPVELRADPLRPSSRDERKAHVPDDERKVLMTTRPPRKPTKRPSRWRAHGGLAALLMLVAVAACGGGAAGAPPSQVGPVPSGSEATPAPGTSGSAGEPGGGPPATAPGASATPSGALSPASPVEMKPIVASAMVEDLCALGLDAKSLPPIEKLEPRTLRGVMKLMARSLVVKCNDCHQEGDFAAPTRRKKIAAHMWDE